MSIRLLSRESASSAGLSGAVQQVVEGAGFGEVAIVIEKRQPVRIRITGDEWLERRGPPPPDQQGPARK